ncbi:MAG: hypothetical protein Q9186_007072 [Xanthomendoza sp. 1 TL-2023]
MGVSNTISPEIQEFGQAFCPAVLASASKPITQAQSTTGSGRPHETSKASHTSRIIRPASTATWKASSAASTPSVANLLGAGIAGTKWSTVHNSPNINRGPAIEAVCITLFLIAAIVVAFRIYARLKTRQIRQAAQGLGWDELFACIVLLLVGGIVATIIAGVRHGMGKHQDHQTPHEIVKIIQIVYAFTLIIILCFGSLKLSILCLYLRMTPERTHRIALKFIMAFVVVNTVAVLFTNIFECTPISDFWNLNKIVTNSMGCINIVTMDIFTNSWSAFEDLVIWALPIPILYKLKVPTARKVGLYTLIGISFISVACAVARANAFVIWIRSSDISWNFPSYPLLCTIESCVALVTSSLPGIYPLFRQPAPEHRRSVVPPLAASEQEFWTSQGSTLLSTQAGDGRSRWSFLSWNGSGGAKKAESTVKSMVEKRQMLDSEERPATHKSMKAFVSSADQAESRNKNTGSHGRNCSSEDAESLCYVGKARRASSSSSISKEEDGLPIQGR